MKVNTINNAGIYFHHRIIQVCIGIVTTQIFPNFPAQIFLSPSPSQTRIQIRALRDSFCFESDFPLQKAKLNGLMGKAVINL